MAIDDAEIRRLLVAGKTIQAVKRYRELTGAGLSASRSPVAEKQRQLRLSGELPATQPVRFGDVLVLCIIVGAFIVVGAVAFAVKHHAVW